MASCLYVVVCVIDCLVVWLCACACWLCVCLFVGCGDCVVGRLCGCVCGWLAV